MSQKTRIKVTCLALFLAALALELFSNNTIKSVGAFAEGPNPGHSGAPGDLTCAVAGCHGGEPNTGPGQFQITAPSSYEPGKTYPITVTHSTTDTSRRRWGFQLTALDGSSNRAGDFESTSITQVLLGGPGGNRQYIEHNFLGTFQGQPSGATWTFNWTAPSSDVGRVTFYAAGNQANNNGNETGDQIYTTSASVQVASVITGAPVITGAEVNKKQLLVSGSNFAFEAQLLMDGDKQKKTFNDDVNPSMLLVARKSGKFIAPGQTVVLQVKNPDGTLSNEFSFTRPN